MYDFFCSKRYDISFQDFHKLIQLVLPTNYQSREFRGFYRKDYMPCNIIGIKQIDESFDNEQCIFCWLGQKGLTVLADKSLTSQICFEVLKNVKQNPEESRNNSFLFNEFNEELFISMIKPSAQYAVFKQMNYYDNLSKFIVREANSDEVEILIDWLRNKITLNGTNCSLYTLIFMIVDKLIKGIQDVSE